MREKESDRGSEQGRGRGSERLRELDAAARGGQGPRGTQRKWTRRRQREETETETEKTNITVSLYKLN